MTSVRERIVRAVLARLAAAIAPVPVLRQPTVPLPREASPALLLFTDGETLTARANLLVDRSLHLRLVAIARGEDAFERTDALIVAAYTALMAEPDLGGLALGIHETDLDWDAEDADAGVVALPIRFDIQYRTSITDLTQTG